MAIKANEFPYTGEEDSAEEVVASHRNEPSAIVFSSSQKAFITVAVIVIVRLPSSRRPGGAPRGEIHSRRSL
ncbi:unnamed protein product [Heligmosomoides polygyrus]|uniref:Uncharacterized protein n=1 Tax=Heligmosomoides polygyrus TaxID=6339 RepID=A0A183G0E4_HELPZ|nr:unnamed protein product [Heligmosomoides polygyrus]